MLLSWRDFRKSILPIISNKCQLIKEDICLLSLIYFRLLRLTFSFRKHVSKRDLSLWRLSAWRHFRWHLRAISWIWSRTSKEHLLLCLSSFLYYLLVSLLRSARKAINLISLIVLRCVFVFWHFGYCFKFFRIEVQFVFINLNIKVNKFWFSFIVCWSWTWWNFRTTMENSLKKVESLRFLFLLIFWLRFDDF